ncbi:DNA helicase MCM8 isoform X2 [Ostrinia furnacalis]|uniref:DNA helicase MCM8 isoform X1 n=1 Tax=Ostrinia furnacalis TaxID=93504 RepID=UPI00103F105A|nr:DNA helicase MCM8 isoform X1 [Ostrinia furnacalis]XP_028156204.1 DNA helicase MCM8 isoform X2 [Ostrinia furnacalis]
MRRNWRGRYRNNWYRQNRPNSSAGADNRSLNNSSSSAQISSAASSSRAPANQLPIFISPNNENSLWRLYFPSEEYPPNPELSEHIKCFKTFIEKNRSLFDLEKIDQTRSVPLDVQSLVNDADFNSNWPTFSTDLFEKPEVTLRLLEYCLHQSLKCESKIKVRVLNHQPVIPLNNLKVNYFGKLVTIKGTVIRVGSVGLICTSMAFECSNCHNIQAVVQPQGVFTAPTVCQSCRGGSRFDPIQSSPFTNTTDWQVAKIQEIQSQGISGTIPRSVEIELQGDLVGTACPGDVLSVTGIVQVRGESKGGEDGKRAARLLQLYIEAVSIHSQRNLSNPTLSFTLKDYYAIQEIHASEDVFRLLVHSLCPTIFGHEAVKAGLILGLIGGTEIDNGTRSNPHVLVVGDPGLGKSQLLQAAAHAAPRGVYVCGASASAGGLTVALGREAGGDFALEAGALVLADQGVCCVDELDKMSAHHSSLLEAMEQRRVSVAKGGVVCSLAARATVLAAANPHHGSYNRAKTVVENLKINSALLSRFDLVFILLDQPDEKIDAMLSEHVLALHSGQKRKSSSKALNVSINTSQYDSDASLSTRLRLKPGEVIDTLPLVLLRKYIAYARRYVHPKLSTEAANALQEFYLELRHNHQGGSQDGTPITTRQLEACIRLTQARARVDLREEATVKDANDVISLMKHSLMDTFSDEFGNIQLSRSINGSGVSSRSKLKKFLDVLTRRAHQLGKDVFTRQELIQIHKAAGVPGDAGELIEAMHTHCYLLLKSSNTYQLIGL